MVEVTGAVMAQKASGFVFEEMAQLPAELVQILTPTGPCAVFGANLVHPKLLGILGALLNLPEWIVTTDASETVSGKPTTGKTYAGPGVHAVVFRGDGVPTRQGKDLFATSHFNTLSMAINLRKHFNTALNTVLVDEPTLSIRAALWHELLTSLGHELHHVAIAASLAEDGSGALWTEDDYNDEEESAKAWAKEKIAELALTDLDMEPPPFNEEPFFGFLFMQANVERVQSGADEATWDNQLKMLTENWAWHDPSDGLTCHSWKDWINVNVQEVVKDATSVEATEIKTNAYEMFRNISEVTIINKDTGKGSVVQTAESNEIVPTSGVMTHTESTFKHVADDRGNLTKVGEIKPHTEDEAIAIFFGAASDWEPPVTDAEGQAPNLTVEALFGNGNRAAGPEISIAAELDPELMDQIVNDIGDDAPMHAEARASVEQTVFTSAQTTVAEQPVHTHTPAQPEMTQAFDPGAVRQTTQLLFQRLFTHIFTKCQPIQGVFANPTAIFEPVPVTDIPGIKILIGSDTINETGQFKKKHPVNGFVKGQIFQTSKLPAYHIYLNVGGVIHQRRIIPQNVNTGSAPALEAAAGNHIGYIIDATEKDRNTAFKFRYINGVITPC